MSAFKSFDDPREIKRRMNELGIDDFVPDSFPRVESQPDTFPVQLTEYYSDQVYAPVSQQAKIADLLAIMDIFQGKLSLEEIRLIQENKLRE